MKYIDFEDFRSQVIVRGILETQTGMHIGSADATETNENPVLKMRVGGQSVPYIPGSSIKGVLRSELERITKSCSPPDVCGKEFDENELKIEARDYCIVCGVFGSMGLGGHVRISDALPKGNISTMQKPGVAINRVLGTSMNTFKFEVVNPNQHFFFQMIIDNIPIFVPEATNTKRISALKYLFHQLFSGSISLGGKTSAGLGVVKLIDTELEILTPSKEEFVRKRFYRLKYDHNNFKLKEVED